MRYACSFCYKWHTYFCCHVHIPFITGCLTPLSFCLCGFLFGGGGSFSQSAKEIYLKDWDPQRNSLPDGRFVILIKCMYLILIIDPKWVLIVFVFSNVERLRDFIRHVYVDRRYSGERSFEKPPRGKMVHILSCSSSILTFRIAHDASYTRRISMMSSLEHIFCSKTFDVH